MANVTLYLLLTSVSVYIYEGCHHTPELYQENFRPKMYQYTETFLNVSVFFKMFLYYSNNIRKIKGPMAETKLKQIISAISLSKKAQ